MDEILTRVICVEELSQDLKKVNIKYGRDKFHFWKNKKDGMETKAFTTFQDMNIQTGDTIEIAFKEEDAEFTSNDGRVIPFKRRTILAIKTADGQEPSPASQKSASQPALLGGTYVPRDEYEKSMNDIKESYLTLTKMVKDLKDKVEGNPPV